MKHQATEDIFDVAVVGGGISGCIAAYHVAKAGKKTTLFEKEERVHQKVCGDFLSQQGIELINSCGINLLEFGAVPVSSLRINGPYRTVSLKIPGTALGISGSILDEQLLAAAERVGTLVCRGTKINGITNAILKKDLSGFILSADEREYYSRQTIIATGKTDVLSAQVRGCQNSGQVGFKQHLKLRPSLARKVKNSCEIFVFKNGYGVLVPIEDGKFNFCFVLESRAVERIGADWDSLASHISRHNWEASQFLDGAETLFRQPITSANIPRGFIRSALPKGGAFFVGDQMAVVPVLAGSGMSAAAMTGWEAARSIIQSSRQKDLKSGRSAAVSYQRAVRTRLKKEVEFGRAVQVFFKNPKLVDIAAQVVSPFPQIANLMFASVSSGAIFEPLKKRLIEKISTI